LGTKLRVRNVENNKTVDVEVVSRGPFGAGRVIDLVLTAFRQIQESWKGLAWVQVTPLDQAVRVLGVDTNSLPVDQPRLTAKSAIAINEKTGQVIFEKNARAVLPMASLTKIMTAVVFLETNTPMDRVITYKAEDNAIGSKLYVSPGDTMTVKDLYYSSLVGSANNATNTLARATGLSRDEFIKRMNAKATAWGLKNTHFTDVAGLDPQSVSTAADYAILASRALRDFRILQGTTTPAYSFRTINTGQWHTIANKNQMFGSPWYITGMKTGYLDEAQYCLMVKARAGRTSSPDVITVILGSATDAARYAETNSLIQYALSKV
jgi:D-alanyl-D-alanine carboxypeptidase